MGSKTNQISEIEKLKRQFQQFEIKCCTEVSKKSHVKTDQNINFEIKTKSIKINLKLLKYTHIRKLLQNRIKNVFAIFLLKKCIS